MFPFAHDNGLIILFLFLLIVGVGTLLFFNTQKILTLSKKFPKSIFSFNKNLLILKKIFLVFSFFFLIIGILRPQWGVSEQEIESKGIDIVFTLDISQSMNAFDFEVSGRKIDRLAISKAMIKEFVKQYPQNRFSLVVFAGDSFTTCPLTLDHEAFLTFLEGISTDDAKTPGTNLEEALATSLSRFQRDEEEKEKRGNLIVLLSDGEEMEGDFSESVEMAKLDNIPIVTVGIGNKEGSLIPTGRDMFGEIMYKKYKGEYVRTKLNEEPLQELANMTNGKYFHPQSAKEFLEIHSETEDLQKEVLKKIATKKGEQFQYFLFFSFLFFLLGILLPVNFEKAKSFFERFKINIQKK